MVKGLMAATAMALLLPPAAQSSQFARAQFLVSLTVVSSCTVATARAGASVRCTPGVPYRVVAAGDGVEPGAGPSISRDEQLVTVLY
jgi:hypothetical protein